MRRFKASRPEECEKVLCETKRGVLAVIGDGGYPYCVPVDFVYEDGRIYIHGAAQGHKSDAIAACDKVCFTATHDDFRKEGDWAWYATRRLPQRGRLGVVCDVRRRVRQGEVDRRQRRGAEKGETSRPKILPLSTGDRRRDRARRSSRAIARDRDRTYDGKTGARKMIRKWISIVLETVVVLCAVAGVALSQSFLYFTIQSNLWIAATLAVFAVWQIVKMFKPSAKDIPEAMWRLKFVFTVSITLTGGVYCAVLAPTPGAFGNAANVLTHVVVPVCAIADLFVAKHDAPDFGIAVWALVPLIYYIVPLLLPQLDVARRRVRLRRRRGILHGDVLVDTRADRAGLRHRARLCGDPQTRERRRRRQNRDRNRGRRGRRGERRRGTTAKWKEATAKTMSVSTPNAASTASPIYKTN